MYVVSVVILAYLAINNQFDVGTFSAFLLLIGKVQSPFMMIANSYAQIQNAYGSSNRILEVINSNIIHEKPLFEISQKNINPDSNSLLSLVNVDYYDESSTFKLENIFFELEKNEIVAIVGESGAGKTTLMKLMMGLISPNKGIIRLNGEDITGRNEGLLSFFTYVPQESLLFEGSIEENLTLGKEKSDNEKYNALSLSNSEHLLHNFPNSLNVKLSELAKNLSGGQKSRISLSRALLKDASILLIDEGTASLDKKSSNTIVRNLMEYVTFDRSIVMITHRLNEIENVDKVYEIIDGTLIRRK
ncbi:ATP-binding cassette domain-containing protein [Alkalibacterium sp. f15]|uniref:ATP-binding cassette domain-containing protein n=1 Tax=Alkalibacterium sp. f15 TaxID=3414029 RepID=UPI003BF8CC17